MVVIKGHSSIFVQTARGAMCDDFVDAPPPRDSPNIKSFAGNFEQLPVARQLDLSQRKDRAGR